MIMNSLNLLQFSTKIFNESYFRGDKKGES